MVFFISLFGPVTRLAGAGITRNKSVLKFYSGRMTNSLPRVVGEGPSAPKLALYGDEASPPVRFVMMTAAVVGAEYHFHKVDLFKGENKSEMYTRINPLQKVPALVVDGKEVMAESVDIANYLCSITRNALIPERNGNKSISEITKINEMIVFNSKTLFPIDSAIFTGYFAGKWPADENLVDQWNSSLDYLDKVLGESRWLAGEQMRLCDICCAVTVSSLRLLLPALDRHSNVNSWLKTLDGLKFFKINQNGLQRLNYYIAKMQPLLMKRK